MFRFNNPDALMVLLIVLAAYCTVRALEAASTRWLLLAGLVMGFSFLAKGLQPFTVLPALALAYLICAPTTFWRRGAAAARRRRRHRRRCRLVGARGRPDAGSRPSLHRRVGQQHRARAGVRLQRRLADHRRIRWRWRRASASPVPPVSDGCSTPQRRTDRVAAADRALVAVIGTLVVAGRRSRTDRLVASLIVWTGWLLVTGGLLSFASGIIHTYYTIELAPGDRGARRDRDGDAVAGSDDAGRGPGRCSRSAPWSPESGPTSCSTARPTGSPGCAGYCSWSRSITAARAARPDRSAATPARRARPWCSASSRSAAVRRPTRSTRRRPRRPDPPRRPVRPGSSSFGGFGGGSGFRAARGGFGFPGRLGRRRQADRWRLPGRIQLGRTVRIADRPAQLGHRAPADSRAGRVPAAPARPDDRPAARAASVAARPRARRSSRCSRRLTPGGRQRRSARRARPRWSSRRARPSWPSAVSAAPTPHRPSPSSRPTSTPARSATSSVAAGFGGGFGGSGSSTGSSISSWVSSHFSSTTVGGTTVYDLSTPESVLMTTVHDRPHGNPGPSGPSNAVTGHFGPAWAVGTAQATRKWPVNRERGAFAALLAATGALYLINLSVSGWANQFYAAAAQAGAKSWKAFLFGSLDAVGLHHRRQAARLAVGHGSLGAPLRDELVGDPGAAGARRRRRGRRCCTRRCAGCPARTPGCSPEQRWP